MSNVLYINITSSRCFLIIIDSLCAIGRHYCVAPSPWVSGGIGRFCPSSGYTTTSAQLLTWPIWPCCAFDMRPPEMVRPRGVYIHTLSQIQLLNPVLQIFVSSYLHSFIHTSYSCAEDTTLFWNLYPRVFQNLSTHFCITPTTNKPHNHHNAHPHSRPPHTPPPRHPRGHHPRPRPRKPRPHPHYYNHPHPNRNTPPPPTRCRKRQKGGCSTTTAAATTPRGLSTTTTIGWSPVLTAAAATTISSQATGCRSAGWPMDTA
ncbi:hypothetical protein DFP73DRAFT_558261 [Morchella snyderi]|nr:hypothetical protein DFP73DRAFT_558261 [Morchella snyderi]